MVHFNRETMNINKTVILFFTCIAFVIGCAHTSKKEQVESNLSIEKQIFISPALNDSLNLFMQTVGDIDSSVGAFKVNNILFFREKNDTIILFLAKLGFYDFVDIQRDYLFLKGGCKVNNEIVAIYYSDFTNLAHFLHEDLIDFSFVEKLMNEIPNDSTTYYHACEWIYRFHHDSLVPIRKIPIGYQGLNYELP